MENSLLSKEVHYFRLTRVLQRILSVQELPFLLNSSFVHISQIYDILFFNLSRIVKWIINAYSLLLFLSYLNCIFALRNFDLLCYLPSIGGFFLETLNDFQNPRIEMVNMKHKMLFLSSTINFRGSDSER